MERKRHSWEGMDHDAGFLYTGQSRGAIRRDAKYITVDTDIERIPNWRLHSLENLVWLEFPDQLKVIGDNAFYCCFVLQRVIFPGSLTDIGNNAFEGCYELNPVVLPEGLQTIGIAAFRSCRSLRAIEVPSTVQMIATSAFADCSSLESAALPDFIEYVNGWFLRCGSLRHVSLSSKTTTIEPYAFSRCWSLMSLELPETMSSIRDGSLISCASLRNVYLPNNISRIGEPFAGCEDLLQVFEEDQLFHVLKHRFDGLPVHRICYFQKYKEENTVLEEIRQSLASEAFDNFQDGLEMTPLHILALSCKPRANLWIELQRRFPRCLELGDKWGSRPIDYLVENMTPSSLPLLTHCIYASTGAPLKSLRSAKWKITILRLIEELSDKTSRRVQVDRIHNMLFKYLQMEALSMLEEALWKVQISEGERAAWLVPANEYRLSCRIKSGAEIVIPNVFCFMEKVDRI
ncbi:unnamed protein product [Cylindrotheca closterium]|uniref:Leucine-rich repeat domain-containing protein n=1 Tax=Cylindrotheca closterium TaxID=2856 RepID=A0AAD2FBW4_9STRA|nr:unnamed protein product [Cylindrotheca closterium]